MNHFSILGGCQKLICRPPIFLWLICLFPFVGFAQLGEKIDQLQATDEENAKILRSVSYPTNPSKPHNLYLHPEWISGWLNLKQNDDLLPVVTRFNILTGAVEVKWQEQIRMLRADAVEMVMIGTHLFLPYKTSPSNYFEVLSHGKLNLLSAYKLTYTYEGSNVLTSSVTGEKKNNARSTFYYFKEGESVVGLKTGKKKILELMDNDPKMKQFITNENLRLSKKEDLVKLFDFYNDQ